MRPTRSRLTRALGLLGLTAALALVAAAPAVAGSASTTFATNLTVTTSCGASAAPVAFPALGLMTATSGFTTATTTGNINLDCTVATPVTIALTALDGSNPSGILSGPGGAQIRYFMFQDSAMTKPWGSGTAAQQLTSIAGTLPVPVYFEITTASDLGYASSNKPAAPGAYTGTVSVSASY
ncbi:MAG TPA: spore coat protein U domain-containing protein [Dyella sp.]|uniref:spore coat protein U domain-containing protein n=1 Tax=Dyella sp. TaxID=1869338 RepID=UPI002C0ADEA3|nr:spore coat protein U domain-containing protein [Dyella sp.]HTV84226.1 spore coat protein U domain-containing protein [Dyella sp.]